MDTHQEFDFSQVSDEELFQRDRVCWVGKEAETAAWHAEQSRRTEAKRQEQERLEKERASKRNTAKSAIAYSEPLATEICERISVGELLIDITEDEHMPTMRRCNQWLKENIEFAALYKDSINDRLNVFEEQVIQLADDMRRDFKTVTKNGKEHRVVDPDVIMRAKLRIDVRFKVLRAMRPERWGEQSTLITKSADSLDPANMSQEELEKIIADIETKSSIANAA